MAKVQIKRVGVFSCAKIYSITLAAIGLIFGILYGLIFMVLGGAMMAAGGGREAGAAGASSLVIGLLMMIIIPITYGIIGFIGGLIGGLVYNVASGVVGGLELELESMDGTTYAPPSPNYGDQPPYTPGQQQQYPY